MMLNNALLGLSGSIGIYAIHLSQGPGDVVSTAAKAQVLLQSLSTGISLYRVESSATSHTRFIISTRASLRGTIWSRGNHPTWGKSGITIQLHSL